MHRLHPTIQALRAVPPQPGTRPYSGVRCFVQTADGERYSFQDSSFHYCEPGSSMELGFPSLAPFEDPKLPEADRELWWERAEKLFEYDGDEDEQSDRCSVQVYCYVPHDMIVRLLEAHGGIAKADGTVIRGETWTGNAPRFND